MTARARTTIPPYTTNLLLDSQQWTTQTPPGPVKHTARAFLQHLRSSHLSSKLPCPPNKQKSLTIAFRAHRSTPHKAFSWLSRKLFTNTTHTKWNGQLHRLWETYNKASTIFSHSPLKASGVICPFIMCNEWQTPVEHSLEKSKKQHFCIRENSCPPSSADEEFSSLPLNSQLHLHPPIYTGRMEPECITSGVSHVVTCTTTTGKSACKWNWEKNSHVRNDFSQR